MKLTSFCLTLIAFLSLVISGCEDKTSQPLKSKSPDGKSEIVVHGKKSGMDPWDLVIELNKEGKTTKAGEVQMYASELSKENVIFNWVSDKECIVKLIEQDGTMREIPIEF